MRKSKILLALCLLLSSAFVTGCGESVIALTDAEETQIVDYCAQVVTKYNTKQGDGITTVSRKTDTTEETTADTETTEADPSQPGFDSSAADGSTGAQLTATSFTTLTDALSVAGMTFEYSSYEVDDGFQTDSFYMSADSGKEFLVLHVTATNTGQEDCDANLLGLGCVYQITLNGTETQNAQSTILLNDLSTFSGTIASGESEDLILLFQFDSEALSDVSTAYLGVTAGGATQYVLLF